MFAKTEIQAAVRDALQAFGRSYDEPLSLPERAASASLGGRLSAWAERVATWNERVDLTAARSVAELVDLLVADAAALARLPNALYGKCVDVGSGAGAPGLALALLLPELSVTLVEPKSKRVAFLRGTVGVLDRPDIRVARQSARDLPRAAWDVAVSRATFEPSVWRAEGLRLAKRVWVLLARQALSGDDATLSVVQELDYIWPLTGAARRAVAFERRPA